MSGFLQKPGGGSSFTGVTVDGTTIVGDGLTTPLSAVFNQQGKYMISGGAVWSGTGLVYDVSFLNYFFDGLKTANASQVTLDASDPSNNRIDAIVVDEAGIVSVITGDPSSSPVEPPIPEDQLQVQFILVEAGSVTPTIASEEIYMDDPTTDWTFTTYDAASPATGTIDFAGTSSPKQGTECIEASTDLRRGARFVRGTSFDAYQYTMLQVWVRFTGTAVASNKSLNVRFENSAGTLVGSTVNLFSYGLQRGVLNTWQLVVVPITAFGALPATVKGLKMIMAGGTVGVVRQWDVDYMILTNGSVPYANVPTIAFYKDGIGFASQPALDLVAGTGVTITPYNDVTNQRARYTIDASGGSTPAGSDTQIQYNNAGAFGASPDFTRSDTLYNSVVRTVEAPKNPTFSGSGLNDLSFSGTFTGENTTTYTITIASTGMLDTYDWTDGTNSGYGSNCNTSPGLLSNGVYIEFTNNIGHTIGDSWTFTFGVSKSVIKQDVYESDFYSLTEDGKLFGFRTNQDGTVTVGNFSSGSAIKLLIDDTAKTAVLGNLFGGNGTKITIDDVNESIELNVGGSTYQASDIPKSIKVSVSSAEILSLNTTPKELIPAPGAGKIIQIISAICRLNYGTIAYDYGFGPDGMNLAYNTTPISGNMRVTDSSDITTMVSITTNSSMLTNEPLNAYATTNPSAGDGTVDLYITYKVVTL